MQVKIFGWSYRGIRGVDNLRIDLKKQDGIAHEISLIMMPNGMGKTTTINLLRAIFNGLAKNWSAEEIRSYKPIGLDFDKGEFVVDIMISEVYYHVYLVLDYQEGRAFYKTARTGMTGGLDEGRLLPPLVVDTFTKDFVDRFIFNGELAKEILDNGNQEAENAIRFLYQLNRLGEMQLQLDRIVESAQQKLEKTTAKTEQGLENLKTQQSKLIHTKSLLESKKLTIEKDLDKMNKELDGINNKINENIQADNSLKEKANELTFMRTNLQGEINNKTLEIMQLMRSPNLLTCSIVDRLKKLSSKMQDLKLPKTMSRQFFEDLARQSYCVCGRSIGIEEKSNIIKRASDYLADDEIGVINAIKTAIIGCEYSDLIRENINELNDLSRNLRNVETEWFRIENHLERSGDGVFQKLKESQNALMDKINQMKKDLIELTTKEKEKLLDLDYSNNIYLCDQKLNLINDKVAEATNTISLKKKVDKMKNYLAEIEGEALKRLKQKVVCETNNKLANIIKTESIVVENIEGSLRLNKSGASEGQSLAIAYSYLGSLFESSTHQLPFVVDSPAGALDLAVRREVSSILPSLFSQLIVFITSGERDGFADYFYQDHLDVLFITISKNIGEQTLCQLGKENFQIFQE